MPSYIPFIIYPLVNCHIIMEHHHAINGQINYFYGHFLNSFCMFTKGYPMDYIPLISHLSPTYHLSNDFPWNAQHLRSFRLKVYRSLNPRCRKVAGSLRPLHFNITFGPRWRWQWPEISSKIWIKFKVDTIKGGLPANKYIYIYTNMSVCVCVLWWHDIMEKKQMIYLPRNIRI